MEILQNVCSSDDRYIAGMDNPFQDERSRALLNSVTLSNQVSVADQIHFNDFNGQQGYVFNDGEQHMQQPFATDVSTKPHQTVEELNQAEDDNKAEIDDGPMSPFFS